MSLLFGVLAAASIVVGERARKSETSFDPAAVARGERVFIDQCSLCHGVRGDGRGTRREGLDPAPPDFTNPEWQSTHTAERVTASIRDGVRGTQMPSWQVLGQPAIHDLVAFVKSRGPNTAR